MLKSLEIKGCLKLKTLDLGGTPNLESLHIEECSSLVKLLAPIGGLKKLTNLKAKGFLRFTNLYIEESYGSLPSLDLHGKLIDTCPLHPDDNFPKFQFDCTYREDLPSLIGNVEKLISVGSSCACTDLVSFFGSNCGLQHLGYLTLQGDIPEAPKDLGSLQCLERFTFRSTSIKHLPDSILFLKHLKSLLLLDCELLEKLPEDLGRLECLERLILKRCLVLRDIPNSICRLKSLKYLSLEDSIRVEKLPEELGRLECLEELDIQGTSIKNLPPSISLLGGLKIVRSEEGTTRTTTTGGCCMVLYRIFSSWHEWILLHCNNNRM
ncbi:protein scribble homolog [Cynara cardunculus var. scolymus]|uniref:protein scribble homolog n=1 Tax=Cynara cardunculus var. scolymus TaxID=59895 RepID=UPI000D62C3F6|nr:protein scribble homolog [Cynara cardunculus var. scolymus]